MSFRTPFTKPDAVDVWDSEFRWRDVDRLHDLTIDDTWRRIAERAASAEPLGGPWWAQRFVDSFNRWCMVPEERILGSLGTHKPMEPMPAPGAVVNVAAFVLRQPASGVCFDRESFVATASLAVRFLDDAARSIASNSPPRKLRIGVIGLADALLACGIDYRSRDATEQGSIVAQALAEGCLLGTIELAEARGRRLAFDECSALIDDMRQRQMPDWLIERALQVGLCHEQLTAIVPHPLVARFANGVADGIDALSVDARHADINDSEGGRVAGLAMRAAMQPWIDEPITGAPAKHPA